MSKVKSKNIIEQGILLDVESTETQYKYHTERVLHIQQELDDIIFKIFNKKKIEKLTKELNEEKEKADKYFNEYMQECNRLYEYHKEIMEGKNE